MGFKTISHNSKPIALHKASITPDFAHKTVIINDYWDYVDMWLRRRRKPDDAKFYWSQARHFYNASLRIPNEAAPLTLYYMFLNAVKAFLIVKKVSFVDRHGATGAPSSGQINLKNEIVTFYPSGVLASLSGYFGDPTARASHSLKDLLYNLPFVHRCFTLTYKTGYQDLFIPVTNPRFVLKEKSREAWFCAELSGQYANQYTVNKIKSAGFEKDCGVMDCYTIRKKKRFDWYKSGKQRSTNLDRLSNYHATLRKNVHYIVGNQTLWYVKRKDCQHAIARHPIPIMFASMHRLSELARYSPTRLNRHFDLDQNWLLSEFIRCSPQEFIDQIACEMTNQDFMFRQHRRTSP